jgi:signal peptidase I
MSEQVIKKRKRWLAVLLTFLMPGLGHIYCGRIVKGIFLFFAFAVIGNIESKIIINHFSMSPILWFTCINLIIVIPLMMHAGHIAKFKSDNYVLKDYNKWYVYVLLFFLPSILNTYSHLYFREKEDFETGDYEMMMGQIAGFKVVGAEHYMGVYRAQ